MSRPLLRAVAALAALAVAFPTCATPRPFQIADLLRLSRFEGGQASPDGRRVAIQIDAPYDRASSYADEARTDLSLGRVGVVDLNHPRRLRLLGGGATGGIILGPFSPSGRRLALFRFHNGTVELGVLTPATGRLKWLGVTPERRTLGQMVRWIDDDRMLVLSPLPGLPPTDLVGGQATFDALARLWRAKSAGRASVLALVGSGRFADLGRGARNRLLRINLATGATVTLARGDFEDVEPTADGRRIALLQRTGDAPLARTERLVSADDGRRRALILLDDATGVARVSAGFDILPGLLRWSADGRLLAFGRADAGAPWESGSFLTLDPDDNLAALPVPPGLRPAVSRLPSDGRPIVQGAWVGSNLLLDLRNATSDRDGWYRTAFGVSARAFEPVDEGGKLVAVGDAQWLVATRSSPVLVGVDGSRTPLPPGSEPAPLLSPGGGLRDIVTPSRLDTLILEKPDRSLYSPTASCPATPRLAPEARLLAFSCSGCLSWRVGPDGSGVLELRRGRTVLSLLRLNGFLSQIATGPAMALHHVARDGRPRTDWLYLPPSAVKGPPLVVLPYPGSEHPELWVAAAPGFLNVTANVSLLTAHGYAVLVPSLPRPPSDVGADGVVEEIEAATQSAAASGRIDPDRMALWGHSFGGYAALLGAERSRLFKAVIAQAAPSDLFAVRGAFDPKWRAFSLDRPSIDFLAGWSEGGQARLGAPPGDAETTYARSSPVLNAATVTAPLLLLHGDQDFVSITQAEEMFSALRRLDKDAVLAEFAGEEHLIEGPGNVRALYALVFDFLAQTLTPPTPSPIAGPSSRSPKGP